MKPVITSLLVLLSVSANAAQTCPSNQVWIEMNCNLCDANETCLPNGGCCPHYRVSPTMDVCCDYIAFDGKCVYHGGKCPDGQLWDISTQKCITGCDGDLVWNGTRCCNP